MASSSSSSHSVLASSSQKWMYDVFLSFRGEDTRKTFVDHLYTALDQQGICTYRDDDKLPRGKSIRPSLFKAIEESQIAIVVFSTNYADSSWCLDELAHVLKCREERGLVVMPVFYDVEPTEVRKQKRKFGEGFSKHESENNNKVEFWRKALVDACNISGWEPKNVANGHESKCIKEIVETISQNLRISGFDKTLIGIEALVKDLKSKLEIESDVVLMIGIWGLGGSGKTTLASTMYHEISIGFGSCCFVENVREESLKYGLKILQEKILSGVLKQKVQVEGVEVGRRMIMRRLCRRKVLLVLDDVDDIKQLEALAGSHDWFGKGSRIIITTRDVHVLNAHKVNVVHNNSLLNDDDAIKLFCKHALQDSKRFKDYELLSREVVSYAGGLPLALKVIGSFLCDKNMNEWKSALDRLKKTPHTNIVEMLKISYDGLEPVEKELFLDIACFFRRYKKDEAMKILDACGFDPVIGVKVLVQKALIIVSEDRVFDMHDLIQEMGHYIVRGEHRDNPEKHSRVWKVEDVRKLCAMDATTALDNIKAIRLSSWRDELQYHHHHHVVTNMKNLRWIYWEGFSESSLPANFPLVELCCLILCSGLQSYLWKGFKGNAIDHHFINFYSESLDHIPRGVVDRLVWVKRKNMYRMELPNNWYNHFSGFLICFAEEIFDSILVEISIRKEVEKEDVVGNFIYEVCQESNEAPSISFDSTACVGYVSFNSLMRDTTCFNSAFNTISISIDSEDESWLAAELVRRKSNGDHAAQITTDSSQFYDVIENKYGERPFKIQHHSKSSVTILWLAGPLYIP